MKKLSTAQKPILLILGAVAIVLIATVLALSDKPTTVPEPNTETPTPILHETIYISPPIPSPSQTPLLMQTPKPSQQTKTTALPVETPISTVAPANPTTYEGFFTLTIDGTNITVNYGVDEETLKKSPGFLPSSALPGTEGTCAVYGHRNRNHLKVLEDAQIGDVITLTMPDGATFTYTVTDITIFESSSDWTLPATSGKTLVLVTCYPFRYSGTAPGKFIVVAKMEE
ncbi:MAG: class D sortase [Clostridia bacterium]|nr:class D sortase [Clostridia bacterium]